MFELQSPATIIDMARHGGAKTYLHWQVLKEMHRTGRTFIARWNGEVLALVCLYPHPADGVYEATFSVMPAARSRMVLLCRMIRLTLSGGPYPAIVTVCRTDAGARIARACGFAFQTRTDLGEVWGYGKPSVGNIRGRSAPPGARGPGEATADIAG